MMTLKLNIVIIRAPFVLKNTHLSFSGGTKWIKDKRFILPGLEGGRVLACLKFFPLFDLISGGGDLSPGVGRSHMELHASGSHTGKVPQS